MVVENHQSYQGIPSEPGYETEDLDLKDDTFNRGWDLIRKYRIAIISVAIVLSLMSIIAFGNSSTPSFARIVCSPDESVISPSVAAVLGSPQAAFCKTSCDSPCASFPVRHLYIQFD